MDEGVTDIELLEGEMNVIISCVAVGVLATAGIWLVSGKGSNDNEFPESIKLPDSSGVMGTIGVLLLTLLVTIVDVPGVCTDASISIVLVSILELG